MYIFEECKEKNPYRIVEKNNMNRNLHKMFDKTDYFHVIYNNIQQIYKKQII
jgi:hypothetical protein